MISFLNFHYKLEISQELVLEYLSVSFLVMKIYRAYLGLVGLDCISHNGSSICYGSSCCNLSLGFTTKARGCKVAG
jgi:hypothetical protein